MSRPPVIVHFFFVYELSLAITALIIEVNKKQTFWPNNPLSTAWHGGSGLTWTSSSRYTYYEVYHLAFQWIRLYFSWIFNLVIFVIQIMKIKTVKTKSSRQCLYQCWAHSNSLCFVNFRKRNWFMKISSENCTKVSPDSQELTHQVRSCSENFSEM